MTRALKFGVAAIAIAIFVLGAALYAKRFGSTAPFRDNSGTLVRGSIAEMTRIRLGGVEQSIVIRGWNANAPILIWLHAGPGQDETGLWRLHNAELEDHFVVVYWTQRGTGRSYHPSIPAKSMTLPQFVADLDQLIAILKSRFHQQRVVLAAHSWGTNIGVSYAQQHPESVSAYVGIGQIANSAEGERRSYEWVLASAKRRRDALAVAELERIGAPPYPIASLLVQRGWLEKYGGGSFHKETSLFRLMLQSYRASEVTWYDGIKYIPGSNFSLNALAPQVAKFDWLHTATRFNMPVFVVAGRYDHNADATLAHDYFDKIEAPAKQFRWFEQSAHSPMFEEPDAFNAFMIKDVLPVAILHKNELGKSAHGAT